MGNNTETLYCLVVLEEKVFLDKLNWSIQESARQARCSTGRPASRVTLEEALKQVSMLQAAKDAAQAIGK